MANNNNKKGPVLPNVKPLIAAGIDARTGLPAKFSSSDKSFLKEDVKRSLRLQDLQDALNRYSWYNLPSGIDGNLIERMLYFKGQAAFFYISTLKQFFFLPFANCGTVDCYGRFTKITPLQFGNGSTDSGEEKKEKVWIQGLEFKSRNSIYLPEEVDREIIEDSAVILWDYSKSISESNIPRSMLQDPILDVMAECIPLMRTSLINSCGVKGMQVTTEDAASNVNAANYSVLRAALTGRKFVPVISSIPVVPFNDPAGVTTAQEFLMTYQSLNNLRLGAYGMSSGSVFQKLGTTLESEQQMNLGNQQHIMDDGLYQRQKFCNIVNSIWNLGIWCEVSENQGLNGTNENVENALDPEEEEDQETQMLGGEI